MLRVVLTFTTLLLLGLAAFGQKQSAESLLGDWTGESKCVGGNPYCHDEIVVYHLTRSRKDSAKINLSADKIVNEKPEFMGEFRAPQIGLGD